MKPKIVLASVTIQYDYLLTKYYYKLPSLGIGYIAAVLEKEGYDVSIVDRVISPKEIRTVSDEMVAMKPDVVGFYCVSETFRTVIEILRMIKEKAPSVMTVVGGPHVYGLPSQAMGYDWIDYSFWGEAEESFLKALESNFSPKAFGDIAGLIYRENDRICINPMALVKKLDSLSFPARHLYPSLNRYRPSILAYKRLPATGIITSRGCAHKCIFCHSGKGHFRLRFHSAEYVLEEIKCLHRHFGINELVFFDDTFLINEERALKICEGIIREDIDISWSCNARANNLKRSTLDLLKRAGCWLIQIGVESGNQDILRTIKKGILLEQVERACRLACDAGLEVKTYFIMGHPRETMETLDDTVRFMRSLSAHYASINFMTPLPGTELWDTAEEYGVIDKGKLENINYLSDRPAFVPFGLTEQILVDKFREAYLKFYLDPRTIVRHVRTLRGAEDIKKAFMAALILLKLTHARFFKREGGKHA